MADKEQQKPHSPVGNLLLRTMAMPGDTNPAGDLFGGWIMSQLDIAGAILAREIAQGRVVTVAVDAMNFLKPVNVGDCVCCYGRCVHVGRTSLKVHLELWVKKIYEYKISERDLVTEASYTYVAVDDNGRPRPLPESAREIARVGIDADSVGLKADGTIKCGLGCAEDGSGSKA
ncbi:MAG: acyl-CoA thioester hydrolase YciA [Proteobacteria bacterium]|uniref:Acyl-CoA thioester hydrolase YciA n=1 Tax=Candidatus Avisuccinivibrio stercorigallinarum TaxID=2840704 RepID=A0A9D9DCF3_9GAMM|nr:acyl-CoA thioester hydrolase YciA [Candidatus Avisuccinivibrio stercorigallinarum]